MVAVTADLRGCSTRLIHPGRTLRRTAKPFQVYKGGTSGTLSLWFIENIFQNSTCPASEKHLVSPCHPLALYSSCFEDLELCSWRIPLAPAGRPYSEKRWPSLQPPRCSHRGPSWQWPGEKNGQIS